MTYIYDGSVLSELPSLTEAKTLNNLIKILSADGLDVSDNTYRLWRDQGNFPLAKLIQLCNICHLPIGYFLKPEGSEVTPAVIPSESWQDITLRADRLIADLLFIKKMTREEITTSDEIGIKSLYDAMRKNDLEALQYLKVESFLGYVNGAGLYLGDYIIDLNMSIALLDGQQPVYYDAARPQIADLQAALDNANSQIQELAQIKNDYEQMRQENAMLSSNYDDLQTRLDTLQQTFNEQAGVVISLNSRCNKLQDENDALAKRLGGREKWARSQAKKNSNDKT